MKEKEEPKPTIIEQINDEFRKLSPNPFEYLTVEFIASRMQVDLFTLQHWMEKDVAFKEGLEIVKRTYETTYGRMKKKQMQWVQLSLLLELL